MHRLLLALLALAPASGAAAQSRQICADNRGGFVAAVEIWGANRNGDRNGQQLVVNNWVDSGRTVCLQTDNPHGVVVTWWVSVAGRRQAVGCASVVQQGRAVVWGTALLPLCYVE